MNLEDVSDLLPRDIDRLASNPLQKSVLRSPDSRERGSSEQSREVDFSSEINLALDILGFRKKRKIHKGISRAGTVADSSAS